MRSIPSLVRQTFAPLATCMLLTAGAAHAQMLIGWAQMPAATFADGPTSGQFTAPNTYGTNVPPFVDKQPVQGFSGVLEGPRKDVFQFLVDNGFGSQASSADALLRSYTLRIHWRTPKGGRGTTEPADLDSGKVRPQFDARTRLQLNDTRRRLTIPIQADYANYYDKSTNAPVDPAIIAGRLLTGADFDVESFRRDRRGNYWFGDEFGPYLIKTDASGSVLRSEIPLPGVYAPQHKDVIAGKVAANLPSSGGFEGMAINTSQTKLYTLLEGQVTGDPDKTRRINEFDLAKEGYTGRGYVYPLDPSGTNIGDMVAVDDNRFIVLERNGNTTTSPNPAPFKKVFLIDLKGVPDGGIVRKTELVDLMNLSDPFDLNADGQSVFTFPYTTIEDVLVLDARTLLVVNDNNFPYGGGRELASDNTEFLKIRLPFLLSKDDDDHGQGHGRDRDHRGGGYDWDDD
ncbi:esterase-like activity of phytase family protein [Variovorax sp. J2P1-59]|uniref:esterase-like activity of phytase family protein n=1 Tax=Variovorax flavidus TaxID=3053501 RepID=UPI0025774624|nr:esterase-like activity of phytase family protein [Variovorax sp. J2P1-59]MDM0078454.1 esterase-like activity of phytase family protein [Variovorax sp. J2P1-59]